MANNRSFWAVVMNKAPSASAPASHSKLEEHSLLLPSPQSIQVPDPNIHPKAFILLTDTSPNTNSGQEDHTKSTFTKIKTHLTSSKPEHSSQRTVSSSCIAALPPSESPLHTSDATPPARNSTVSAPTTCNECMISTSTTNKYPTDTTQVTRLNSIKVPFQNRTIPDFTTIHSNPGPKPDTSPSPIPAPRPSGNGSIVGMSTQPEMDMEVSYRLFYTKTPSELSGNAFARRMEGIHRAGRTRGHKRTLQCATCHKTFKREAFLRKHFNAVHLKKRPYECAVCGNLFGYKVSRDKHVRTVHLGARPWRCAFQDCGKHFSEKGNALKHFNNIHATAIANTGDSDNTNSELYNWQGDKVIFVNSRNNNKNTNHGVVDRQASRTHARSRSKNSK